MSPEEQRISITLQCGAKWRLFDSGYTFLTFAEEESGFTDVDAPTDPSKIVISETVPDYLGSLDAMHEAEKALKGDRSPPLSGEVHRYFDELIGVCGIELCVSFATAPQRAEAFLRALNLWT